MVATDHPETRELFRQLGEETDRAVFGHLETIDHFARRRGVDREWLLEQLATTTGLKVDRYAARDEGLHRPFVLTALIVTLTLGAAWGAYLMWQIGVHASFQAVAPAHVVAHGTAQCWGFVAVFIIGIALRYLVSATGQSPPTRPARGFVLWALLIGVAAQFAWSIVPQDLPLLGPLSGIALVGGSTAYLALVTRFVRPKSDQVWSRFVLMAAAWLVVWSCWTLWLQTRAADSGPGAFSSTERQLVIDLALFGLAIGSVYGFGRKLLPGFLATAKPRCGGCFEATFWLHNGGLVGVLVGRTINSAPAVIAGLCCIGVGAVVFVVALRGLRGRAMSSVAPERGHAMLRRYIQLAFAWLLLTLVGFVIIALMEGPGRVAVPHAIHGAARHALTVGFLVTLILGVGQRLLPVLGHSLLAWPGLVGPIFVLIASGNLLRVVSEVATTWWSPAYVLMPFSAILELAALALFCTNAIMTMWPRPDSLLRTGLVTPSSSLATLVSERPWIEDLLIDWGIEYINRVRRIPTELTIGTFAASNGHDPDRLIERINAALREPQASAASDTRAMNPAETVR